MIFGMVSTKNSATFTVPAVTSFFSTTQLSSTDQFVLIENEPHLGKVENVSVVRNETPRSFAANANYVLDLAHSRNEDVLFMNNDIIFTKDWLHYLPRSQQKIAIPYCNQQARYSSGPLIMQYLMDWEQFSENYEALNEIADTNRIAQGNNDFARERLMPFYCFYLPFSILSKVGKFDESFGNGGGEDVDYRLRALLQGFDVAYGVKSYLLHFMGKSTWRGPESREGTANRDATYRSRFTEKWGADLAEVFLAAGPSEHTISRLHLSDSLRDGDFRSVIEKCMI